MEVIVRSNSNPVNDMSVWLVIVMDFRSGYSCHQEDKQILGGCLRNQVDQAAE